MVTTHQRLIKNSEELNLQFLVECKSYNSTIALLCQSIYNDLKQVLHNEDLTIVIETYTLHHCISEFFI